MIAPSDPDYQETKLIKMGARTLESPFSDLAKWIEDHFQCGSVLNFHYEKTTVGHQLRPLLSVIFELEDDCRNFNDRSGNFDTEKQDAVARQFREILAERENAIFDTQRLIVTFSAFDSVARVEANWKATEEDIEFVRLAISDPTLWLIRPSWDHVTFFFHTEEQLKTSATSDIRVHCASEYSGMLSRYDEFGYFKKQPISVLFDSKENFEAKYQANWFNYDR